MNTWVLLQIALNIFFVLTFVVMWSRLKRPPQDDPRLSRGLQLLQSKISVLEDLSDRTELQVKQLTTLLEKKGRQLQQKIQESAEQINFIDQSMEKSMEVANIFQDKIPHEEIIERQNTVKYVRAARLAHQGMSVDEIVHEVDLPKSEVEFIAKINRDQLMFDDQQLPQWAKEREQDMALDGPAAATSDGPFIEMNDGSAPEVRKTKPEVGAEDWSIESAPAPEPVPEVAAAPVQAPISAQEMAMASLQPDLSGAFALPNADMSSLQKLGAEFRQACDDFDARQDKLTREEEMPRQAMKSAGKFTNDLVGKAADSIKSSGVDKAAEAFKTKVVDRAAENLRTHVFEKAEKILQHHDKTTPAAVTPAAVTPAAVTPAAIVSPAPEQEVKTAEPVVVEPVETAEPVESQKIELDLKPEGSSESSFSFEIADDSEEPTTHIVPNSYLKETLNHNQAEDTSVASSEVKKVLFPRIDMNDNLG